MKSPIYVVLDNIRSALNVGAIFRTCDAVNVQKLLLCGITAYPPHNRIPKTALGASEFVQWEYYKTTLEAMNSLTKTKVKEIVSVELTKDAKNFWNYKFKFPLAIVFGNEVTGVSKEILKLSDAIIKIPMFGKKESLNVATTVGITLYEVAQRLYNNVTIIQ